MTELIDALRERANTPNNTKTYRETTGFVVYKLVSKRKKFLNYVTNTVV